MAKPKVAKVAKARPASAKPLSRPAHWDGALALRVADDGSLTDHDLERLALLMADDVAGPAGWSAMGKANNGTPGTKRRAAEKDAVFQARLGTLTKEKTDLHAADPTWGPVEWKANQLWRHAAATADTKLMMEAAKLAYQVANAKTPKAPAPAEAEDDDTPSAAGRPVASNPQSTRDPMVLRGLLRDRGAKGFAGAEKAVEDDEND